MKARIAVALSVVAILFATLFRAGDTLPEGWSWYLASGDAALAEVIQRSLVEVGPMVRIARGLAHGISPEALVRGASVLKEASNFYDDMMSAVEELHRSSARLAKIMAARANANAASKPS